MRIKWLQLVAVLACFTLILPATSQARSVSIAHTQALPSSVTVQGTLATATGVVSGNCDLRLTLYDAIIGGNQIDVQQRPNTLLDQGRFSLQVTFDTDAFSGARWLETAVRCPTNTGSYTILTPRQPFAATPFAISAINAEQSVGDFSINGADLHLQGDATLARGDGGRALVHEVEDRLVVNYQGDFAGGIVLDSSTRISGELTVDGPTIRLLGYDLYMNGGENRGDGGRALVHTVGDTLAINYDNDFAGGVVINDLRTGKVIEQNLMTAEQQQDTALLPFSQGDVLCWDEQSLTLALCTHAASPLVVAVADAQGRPVVLGAEPLKVLGPIQPGDLLVSAEEPGYAIAWTQLQPNRTLPVGVTVAKALEPLDIERGMIKALVILH